MKKFLFVNLIVSIACIHSALADNITKPNTFTAGTTSSAAQVNANFDTLYTQVNKVGAIINTDPVNSRIGIGTATPLAKVQIDEAEGANFVSLRNTVNGGAWDIKLQGDARTVNNLHFSNTNNNITTMTLATDGNVGIGTTSPVEALEVVGNIKMGLQYATIGLPAIAAGSWTTFTQPCAGKNVISASCWNQNAVPTMWEANALGQIRGYQNLAGVLPLTCNVVCANIK